MNQVYYTVHVFMKYLRQSIKTYYIQKEVNMWSFVNKKSNWMSINGHFEDEIGWRSRLDSLT